MVGISGSIKTCSPVGAAIDLIVSEWLHRLGSSHANADDASVAGGTVDRVVDMGGGWEVDEVNGKLGIAEGIDPSSAVAAAIAEDAAIGGGGVEEGRRKRRGE